MEDFVKRVDNSWIRDLDENDESEDNFPNQKSRQVTNGHYVRILSTKLPKPELVIVSQEMMKNLGLTDMDIKSKTFLNFFSADPKALPSLTTWATPYALSQSGHRVYTNCPFGNGCGYGDGRAASIAEVIGSKGKRWECQLKGSGPTPFCRGADGKAVLRSSVREFLVSEAMFHLNVETTRALCLIVSGTQTVRRPWYSDELKSSGGFNANDPRVRHVARMIAVQMGAQPSDVVDMLGALVADTGNHPLLNHLTEGTKVQLKHMLTSSSSDPDIMMNEKTAITTRVAPSFLRIGHLDLHARRVLGSNPTARAYTDEKKNNSKKLAMEALEKIAKHALFREFQDVDDSSLSLSERVLIMIQESGKRIATLVSNWLRVGFCQGNFNCDNCLVAGRTMDYGPFGFMEKYDRFWNMWVGGGRSYSFSKQPDAAYVVFEREAYGNFETLVTSLMPLMIKSHTRRAAQYELDRFQEMMRNTVNKMWMKKLGLSKWNADLYKRLETLMQSSRADFTITFRQLSNLPEEMKSGKKSKDLFESFLLKHAFYNEDLSAKIQEDFIQWIGDWRSQLESEDLDFAEVSKHMKQVNPKYVPREWMLVRAYTAAQQGDYSTIRELHELFKHPYDEGTKEMSSKYYRRAPSGSSSKGGTGFMT